MLPPWNHQWFVGTRLARAVEGAVERHGLATGGRRVVDLGCGDKPYEPLFRARGAVDYVGCDLDAHADVVLRPGTPCALPSGSADVVVSFQVLEHVLDLDWYLGEARRIVRDDGRLLLSTHGVWLYHPHPTDYRRWTRDGLVADVERRGFRVEDVVPVVGPLAWTTQIRLLGLRHALLMLPAVGGVLARLAALVMNARMILEEAITPPRIRHDNACIYVVLARKA